MRCNDEDLQDFSNAESLVKVHGLKDKIEELSSSHSTVMKWIVSLLG